MASNYFNPFFSVKVMDGLFICNQTAVKDQQFILNNKFSLVVNTCPREFKVLPVQNIYKVTNFHWANSKNQLIQSINISNFKPIFQQITTNLEEGHGSLIVSERGHSRAITFVLLYLMTKFQWELLKSLQYINSKRQNLSVRATYLKLLVSYQKALSSGIQNNKTTNQEFIQNSNQIISNDSIHNHLKSSTKSKWKDQHIKTHHQKLITNTFKNTIKKKHINDINLQYLQILNKQYKNQSKFMSINGRYNVERKIGKSVKFSNEIQIIIGQSPASHNFPQYNKLMSEGVNKREENNQLNSNHNKLGHNTYQQWSTTSNKQPLQRQNEMSGSITITTKKQPMKNIKLINVRKIQHKNVKQQKQSKRGLMELHNFNGDSQEFDEDDIILDKKDDKKQRKSNHLIIMYPNQHLHLDPWIKTQYEHQTGDETNIRQSQQLSSNKSASVNHYKKTRLSSYKKLKSSILQGQIKNTFSPIKKQHNQQRVQTQPKNDIQIINHLTPQSRNSKRQEDKRVSASQTNDIVSCMQKNQFSHQRKSLSLAMEMKPMSLIEKVPVSKGKQRRCQTPQLVSQNLLIHSHSQSKHNNFHSRALSRGKSNSVRVNKKSVQSPSLQKIVQKQQSNNICNNSIFNVNINVNIGKLQMFGPPNGQSISSIKDMKNKEKLFKNHSQLDKMGLINSRPRSNSSNQNYTKPSFIQVSSRNQRESDKNKMGQRISANINKSISRHIMESQDSKKINNKMISTFATSLEELNLGVSESFSKQQIINKINKKLIHHNDFHQNHEQSTKNPTIKRNNFI